MQRFAALVPRPRFAGSNLGEAMTAWDTVAIGHLPFAHLSVRIDLAALIRACICGQ